MERPVVLLVAPPADPVLILPRLEMAKTSRLVFRYRHFLMEITRNPGWRLFDWA
jgi:hypothetical protein